MSLPLPRSAERVVSLLAAQDAAETDPTTDAARPCGARWS